MRTCVVACTAHSWHFQSAVAKSQSDFIARFRAVVHTSKPTGPLRSDPAYEQYRWPDELHDYD